MMMRHFAASLPATLTLLLCACGGGGTTGSVQSIPAAPITPPTASTPPAPITPPPLPNGPLGLSAGPFVTQAANWDGISGEWPKQTTERLLSGPDLVSISYSAADNSYTLTLPDFGTGTLRPVNGSGIFNAGSTTWSKLNAVNYALVQPNGIAAPVTVAMDYAPDSGFTYTSTGFWSDGLQGNPKRAGVFAYGQATTDSAMPVSGTASFGGEVRAYTRTFNDVWGTVDLSFDFGAGTLSGKMVLDTSDGWDPLPLGTFPFQNTVYSKGSTSFSGAIAAPNAETLGSFSGQFTGPGAPELLGNFRTPAFNPLLKSWDEIAGVFVGKRK
ncbi:transferrin-binding protein-like solute binding protein [Sphingomonas glaciei]|uniref:Transferrin-binding protein-like solute binding protein n=1 Tax=Sphingomonas glaciei TaxID=2938948 RepID=A0ABY5MWU8_9SPHN|nr:transferrin-binding protein-like solute binding protein [Sphingomonas glaciei]UUR08459.1 transferrin-binding protein-like solute binding protein [Sphingomonas glaciei]